MGKTSAGRRASVRLTRNPLRLLDCKNAPCQPFKAGAPRITDNLCDACQAHFDALRRYLPPERYTVVSLVPEKSDAGFVALQRLHRCVPRSLECTNRCSHPRRTDLP